MKGKSFIAVVVAALIAGLGGIFIKFIDMDATAIAWMRTTVPTLFLGALLLIQKKKLFKSGFLSLFKFSVLSSFRIYLFIMAYVLTSVGNAVVLFYTYPIFTLLLANRLLGEQMNKKQIGLMLFAFLGLVIVYSNKTFSFSDSDFLGMFSAIGAAIVFAYVVILMKKTNLDYERNEVLFYQNLSGMILFLPFFLMDIGNISLKNVSLGIGYGMAIGVVTFSLFMVGLKYMKASITSSLMYLEIPSTMILGYFILGESLSWNVIIGGSFIILSSFLLKP